MPQPPSKLEMYYLVDGDPGRQKIEGDVMELGEYDVSIGTEFDFFIRNPNHNKVADISDFHTGIPDASFHGPDKIFPLETARCTIKIKPNHDMNIDNFDLSNEGEAIDYSKMLRAIQETTIHGKLEGKLVWKSITFETEDTNRTYGWGR